MANEAVRELEDAAAEAFGYLADLAKESDRTGAKACADRLAAALRGMDEAPPRVAERSLRSFLWNLRVLGPSSWLRCAVINAWRAIFGRRN